MKKEKNMKKSFLFLLFFSLFFILTGCVSAPNVPKWINNKPKKDVIWGIGVAKQSDVSMSMTIAEARARAAIARQLDVWVKAMFTNNKFDSDNENNHIKTYISNQVTAINLSGAITIKRWEAKDGTWWILVEYKKNDARSAIADIINNDKINFSQADAQYIFQILDKQLARNVKPLQVGE